MAPSPDASPAADEPGAGGHSGTDGFRHLGEEEHYRAFRFALVEAKFAAPDGHTFTRQIIRHSGAVAVVPLTDHDSALLVRQYRGSVDRWLLEIPAGTRDVDGEAPELTAARELEEEVGVRAGSIELLCAIHNTPGFCDQETLLYLATGLTPAPTGRHGPEEELMEVVDVPLAHIDDLVRSGELTDAETLIGLLLVRSRLTAGDR